MQSIQQQQNIENARVLIDVRCLPRRRRLSSVPSFTETFAENQFQLLREVCPEAWKQSVERRDGMRIVQPEFRGVMLTFAP
jgi:hypothetical protein